MTPIIPILAQAANSPSVPITLGVSAVLGLFLFVMGRKLVKTAIGISGLCIGAAAAFVGANQMGVSSELMLVWVIGGAVAGVLLAALLFRFWMAASLAALVALAVPAFSVIWQGTPPPASAEVSDTLPAKTAETEPKKRGDLPVNNFSAEDAKKAADKIRDAIPIDEEDLEHAKQTIMEVLQRAYEFQKAHLTGWWESLNSQGRRNMTITTAIAGLVGALFGFALPYFSASIQTSLIGGAILLSTTQLAISAYAPQHAGWLPSEPRALLITLSLITVVGVCIQWTLWRKTADK